MYLIKVIDSDICRQILYISFDWFKCVDFFSQRCHQQTKISDICSHIYEAVGLICEKIKQCRVVWLSHMMCKQISLYMFSPCINYHTKPIRCFDRDVYRMTPQESLDTPVDPTKGRNMRNTCSFQEHHSLDNCLCYTASDFGEHTLYNN